MLILRKPPFPLTAVYSGLTPSEDFAVNIRLSSKDGLLETIATSSNSSGEITIEIPKSLQNYDDTYALEIVDSENELVLEDNLTIERPYVDPSTLGSTASEIAEYTKHERLARAIIDSITGGFYFKLEDLELTGQGTDYMPVWNRTYKVIKAYENTVLVYDASLENPAIGSYNYLISQDKTAIIKDPAYRVGEYNRSESAPIGSDLANSDSISLFDTSDSGNMIAVKFGVLYPEGVDYIFEVEQGYKVVPYDIQDATRMLIDDIVCGRLEYFKRYITDYSTDQFKIKVSESALDGTGNILVDKILEKYIVNVGKPGVI